MGVIVFSGLVTSWLARGEKGTQLTDLTGRTMVWTGIINAPHDAFQLVLGHGFSNESFNGLPIDSNWLAAYWELGLAGAAICAAMLLFVLVAAYFQPRSPQRALALFLVAYLLVRSFTETGLTVASANLLDLTLAASLVVSSAVARQPE